MKVRKSEILPFPITLTQKKGFSLGKKSLFVSDIEKKSVIEFCAFELLICVWMQSFSSR